MRTISGEQRKKISVSLRGRKASDETRRRQRLAHAGHRHSPETIAKIRTSNLGQKRSRDFRDRLSLIRCPDGPAFSEPELRRLYLDEGKTDAAIAEICGRTRRHIKGLRSKYGIRPSVDQWSARKSRAASGLANSNVGKRGVESPMYGRRGDLCPFWKGGRHTHPSGYIYVYSPAHPAKNAGGYVREHRLLAEKILSRYLTRSEVVHHINGNRSDNRPENLIVFRHQGAHLRFEKKAIARPGDVVFDGRG